MLKQWLVLLLCFVGVVLTAQAQQQTININQDWYYWENNTQSYQLVLENSSWQSITLPHTWNTTDTVDTVPGYRRSASWYKRIIPAEAVNPEGLTQLYFEGANFETEVYLNGQRVGEHTGGYIGFMFDITPFLNSTDNNELLVRVSNRFNPNLIPSQKADFFLFGGITRDVWIKHVPTTHITQTHVATPSVSKHQAQTQISIELTSAQDQQANISIYLESPSGEPVSVEQKNVDLVTGNNSLTVDLPTLQDPQLWSPDSPSLYTVTVRLSTALGSIHTDSHSIGYRWFEMKPHQGFFLNGERLLIRGTHRHEEHAGLGAALPNAQHRKDMEMIKQMGANFVRLGHYPQDPEVYQAANELGLLIWDELPWCRGGKGGKEWEANTEYMLTSMVNQNMNHPSVIFWSLGNEMYWEEDFVGGGADNVINPYLTKLNDMVKTMDPYRLTTLRKYYPGWDIVDAFSPSIWAGWYGGAYNQYQAALEHAMEKYPAFLHMEYGGSSHVGRHTETPVSANGLQDAQVSVAEAVNQVVVKSVAKDSDWNESYIVDLFDWHLNVSESLPNFAGNAQWAFKDFGTPLRPENPIPYINMKGLVDRNGNPKDAYYVFASYWSTDPMCWIESHTWTHRSGPKEGRDVTVYCNTSEAELFLNGDSLGRKTKQTNVVPAGGLVWKVPFVEGDNQLHVNGLNDDHIVASDTLAVNYLIGNNGDFDHIRLTTSTVDKDKYMIHAEARDASGNRVLDYAERAYFFNIGDNGQLVENHGTPTQSSTIEMANGYAAIEFELGDYPSTIEFRTQNIKGVYVEVPGKQE